jgi:hypothetical protein
MEILERDSWEMVNLVPRITGLPMTVWAQPSSGLQHDARIKVSPIHGRRMVLDDSIVVGLRPYPQQLIGQLSATDWNAVQNWIRLNESVLLDYWDFTIDTDEFLQRLQALSPPNKE